MPWLERAVFAGWEPKKWNSLKGGLGPTARLRSNGLKTRGIRGWGQKKKKKIEKKSGLGIWTHSYKFSEYVPWIAGV